MPIFTLPIAAAENRIVVGGESEKTNLTRLSEEERRRTYGLQQATVAICAALSKKKTERTILEGRRRLKPPQEIASGWVLAERLGFSNNSPGKDYHRTLGGIMLTSRSDIYVYEAALPKSLRMEYAIDAWGHRTHRLHPDQVEVACHRITEVDMLDVDELPQRDTLIGAIAAPLTLDDTLAGLAVRYHITLPELVVPETV